MKLKVLLSKILKLNKKIRFEGSLTAFALASGHYGLAPLRLNGDQRFVLTYLSKIYLNMDPKILKITKDNLNPLENDENSEFLEFEKNEVPEKKSKLKVDFPVRLNLVGKCMNAWKNNNILGEFEFTDLDETNRPMFRRLEKTRDGEEVILFYFEWEKCWQIGGRPDDPDAEESCWAGIHELESQTH